MWYIHVIDGTPTQGGKPIKQNSSREYKDYNAFRPLENSRIGVIINIFSLK